MSQLTSNFLKTKESNTKGYGGYKKKQEWDVTKTNKKCCWFFAVGGSDISVPEAQVMEMYFQTNLLPLLGLF